MRGLATAEHVRRFLAALAGAARRPATVYLGMASPDQFVPVAPGWQDRSPWVMTEGHLTIRHFDLTAQALSKIERGHARDLLDVAAMLERGLISRRGVLSAFEAVTDDLYRYPALDPTSFAAAVRNWANEGILD